MKTTDRLNKRYDELNRNTYYLTIRDQQLHCMIHKLNTITGFMVDEDDCTSLNTDDLKYMIFTSNNLPQPFRKSYK